MECPTLLSLCIDFIFTSESSDIIFKNAKSEHFVFIAPLLMDSMKKVKDDFENYGGLSSRTQQRLFCVGISRFHPNVIAGLLYSDFEAFIKILGVTSKNIFLLISKLKTTKEPVTYLSLVSDLAEELVSTIQRRASIYRKCLGVRLERKREKEMKLDTTISRLLQPTYPLLDSQSEPDSVNLWLARKGLVYCRIVKRYILPSHHQLFHAHLKKTIRKEELREMSKGVDPYIFSSLIPMDIPCSSVYEGLSSVWSELLRDGIIDGGEYDLLYDNGIKKPIDKESRVIQYIELEDIDTIEEARLKHQLENKKRAEQKKKTEREFKNRYMKSQKKK